MSILPKTSWIALGQVSAAFTMIIFISVYFLDAPTAKEGVLMWYWSILGAFTSLKLQQLSTTE
jgi:hypothetical protein